MPIADVTFHSTDSTKMPRFRLGGNERIDLWPPMLDGADADAAQLNFSGGVQYSEPFSDGAIARIVPDAACRAWSVGAGDPLTAERSKLLIANQENAVFIQPGERLGVGNP